LIGFSWEKMEGKKMEAYHFPLERYQMHDPLGIVEKRNKNDMRNIF
jgi:hypothetical protein